ncbi:MAG: hypothetical protein JW827_06275 [Spirochaetes bacterium]|nr:hypothetical protein [Spirochaetota bacterium]
MKKCRIMILVILSQIGLIFSQESVEPIKFEADRVEYVFKKGNEKTLCRGNAKIWRSDFTLFAQLIKIIGKDNNYAEAYNKVKLISPKDNTIITGGYAEYDNVKGYAKVFKSPVLVVTNRDVTITSAVMENYMNENISIALGDVKITQTNYVAFCEKGIYYKDQDKIEMLGNPIVYYDKDEFRSKKIIVYIKEKKVKLYDDVEAEIRPK